MMLLVMGAVFFAIAVAGADKEEVARLSAKWDRTLRWIRYGCFVLIASYFVF